MADQKDAGTHSGLLNPDHYSDYFVRDRGEILLMLRRMREQRVLLNVHIDGGPHRFVSAVLDSGVRGLILDAGPDEWLNTHAISADFLTCSAQLDNVRVQFDVSDISSVAFDKLPALFAPLPKAVLRLQRRESYRLTVPMRNTVTCKIVLEPPAPPEPNAADGGNEPPSPPPRPPVTLRPRVIDISMNGIGFVLEAESTQFSVGQELRNCEIALPESESATVVLKVRNLHQTTNPAGARTLRVGCEMSGVPPRFTNLIQRYIFKVERERRMFEPGS